MASPLMYTVAAFMLGFILANAQDVNTEDIQACTAQMINKVMPFGNDVKNPAICPIIEEYAKCILRSSGAVIDESNAAMFEAMLQRSFAQQPSLQGMDCDFDLTSLMNNDGSDPGPVEDTNFDTGDPCLDTYLEDAFGITDVNNVCPLAEKLLRCELNRYPNKKFSNSDIRNFENMLQNQMNNAGATCQIDVRGIMQQQGSIGDNGNSGNSMFGHGRLLQGLLASVLTCLLWNVLA